MKGEEDIAWHLINNLTARVGTRLAGSGLFLAVTSFLIGGVLAVFVGNPPDETALSKFQTDDWVMALWIVVFVALSQLGIALFLFLQSARSFRIAQNDISRGVAQVGQVFRGTGQIVDQSERAYIDGSATLLAGVGLVEQGSWFLWGGLVSSLGAFVYWAYLIIWR